MYVFNVFDPSRAQCVRSLESRACTQKHVIIFPLFFSFSSSHTVRVPWPGSTTTTVPPNYCSIYLHAKRTQPRLIPSSTIWRMIIRSPVLPRWIRVVRGTIIPFVTPFSHSTPNTLYPFQSTVFTDPVHFVLLSAPLRVHCARLTVAFAAPARPQPRSFRLCPIIRVKGCYNQAAGTRFLHCETAVRGITSNQTTPNQTKPNQVLRTTYGPRTEPDQRMVLPF